MLVIMINANMYTNIYTLYIFTEFRQVLTFVLSSQVFAEFCFIIVTRSTKMFMETEKAKSTPCLFSLLYKSRKFCFDCKYTLRRKGSIWNLRRFYQRYVFGTPKRFYTLLRKVSSGFYI